MIGRLALAAALAVTCVPLYATQYTLEPQHSEGMVRWSHLGFSNPTAQFTQVEGTLDFDQADPTHASVTATIRLSNFSSGVPDLDDNLHTPDFFNIAKYPTATFRSTRVERGSARDQLKVTGDLTLRGITRPVTLDVTINKVGINIRNNLAAVGFDATTTLKRSDFGLGLYVPLVSDEVSIHITCQGDEAKGYLKLQQKKSAEAAAEARTTAK